MLGKLLKYDFRSVSREFMLLWPAALVIGLVMRFTVVSGTDHTAIELPDLVNVLVILAYFAVMVAMFVIALLFIIQRFYKGLLGQEGYLMNTLPVRPWQLVTSKLICAVVVTLVSCVVAALSVFLMIPLSFEDIFQINFGTLWQQLMKVFPDFMLMMVELGLMVLIGLTASITQLYFSMAIGHLFGKNRIAGSIVAYVGIGMAINVLFTFAIYVLNALGIQNWTSWNVSQSAAVHLVLWLLILSDAVLTALFFFGTTYILKNKLNLE